MTLDLKSLLSRALEVTQKATCGKWRITFENPEGFPCVFLDEAMSIDVTNADLTAVEAWRALAEPLLRVAMAAREKALEGHHDPCRYMLGAGRACNCGTRELDEALAKLLATEF